MMISRSALKFFREGQSSDLMSLLVIVNKRNKQQKILSFSVWYNICLYFFRNIFAKLVHTQPLCSFLDHNPSVDR